MIEATNQQETTMNIPKTMMLATLAFGLAAPTFAASPVGPDITVRFGDLAIDTEQGASSLLRRIEWAAQRVCAPLDHGTLASRINARNCARDVTAAAVTRVSHPVLQAVYDSSMGISPPVASLGR
jgi:UrcA family protein